MSNGADKQSATIVEPISPDDPNSLGFAISRVQERRVFSGHPADLADTADDAEPPIDDSQPSGMTAAETPPAAPPAEPDTQAPEGDLDFKPKYKSHREAELGYKEAERKMHEATQAAAAARAELEQLRRELEELKASRVEAQAQPEPEKAPVEPKTNEQLVAAYEKALSEISELDPYDPNYHKLAAQAWAKTGLDQILLQTVLSEVERRLEGRISGKPTASPEPPTGDIQSPSSPPSQQVDSRQLVSMAEEMARKAGLDMTPGSLDHRLFWSNLNFLPDGLTFNDEVKWMIQETMRLKPGTPSRSAPESIHQRHAILERGGDISSPSSSDQPVNLSTLIDHQMRRRVI